MKNDLIYAYGIGWIMLLGYIGKSADESLLSLIRFFNLGGVSYIRTYILAISIILLIISFLLVIGINPLQQLDKKIVLRILVASVFGGHGGVWLLMVFLSHEL